MTSENLSLGPWSRVRVLGRGGFGLVTLWKNKDTEKLIAIKCLREKELERIIKPKHKERWCKEVEIMHKLQHKNIVSALPVPDELAVVQASMPLLAMEYCTLGDLRQMLVKPENCCGLKESMILDVLRDVSCGLTYLHSCKIIHRDLKPDNIVLQAEDDHIVYKLIDLGYAKELEQGSQCESFVGTVQYLAPELFMGKPYTCSVDYWSFGQVAHEIITGHRPFLPGMPPAAWMTEIQNKKRSVISVVQTWSGETIHSSSLSKVNHLSGCLRDELELWLQLALEWDGRKRGRDQDSNELIFFTFLNRIVEKKVVRVFSLPTCEVLSYSVNRDTTVANLQTLIARDISIETDDQILLLTGGKIMSPKSFVLSNLPKKVSNDDVSIYLYTSCQMKIQSKPVLKPLFVRELIEDPKRLLEYPHLKRTSSDAVFVVQSEVALYKNIMDAIQTKIENIKDRTLALESLYDDVVEEWIQAEATSQFFLLSHKTDLEKYIELRKAGGISSSDLVQKWIKKGSEIENKMKEIQISSHREKLKQEVAEVKSKTEELVNHPFNLNSKSPLDDLLAECLILYDKVQNIPKDVRGHPMSNTDIVRVVLKAAEASAKLLKSPALTERFQKIFECEDHLAKLISPLSLCLKSTKILKQMIESTQKERQREVWELLTQTILSKNQKSPEQPPIEKPVKPANLNGQFSPFHIPKTVCDPVSPMDENMLRVNFCFDGPVSVEHPVSIAHPPTLEKRRQLLPFSSAETSSIIQSNNEWRFRTEDLALSCQEMVNDIKSLNWDFLNHDG